MSRLSILLVLGGVLVVSGNKLRADHYPPNAGFEDSELADGDYTNFGEGGWTIGYYTLPDLDTWAASEGDGSGGIWNPSVDDYPGEAPGGENIGWAGPFDGYDTGLTQVLSVTLAADTQYILSAEVGNPSWSDAPGAARLEIRAGGVLLAASDSIPGPDLGTFVSHSLVYDSGADPAQLGETLEIRLICEGIGGAEMDFDEVSFVVAGPTVEVPTVTEWGMISLALLLVSLGVFRLHRRKLALSS
jgi:hypothetical protein